MIINMAMIQRFHWISQKLNTKIAAFFYLLKQMQAKGTKKTPKLTNISG